MSQPMGSCSNDHPPRTPVPVPFGRAVVAPSTSMEAHLIKSRSLPPSVSSSSGNNSSSSRLFQTLNLVCPPCTAAIRTFRWFEGGNSQSLRRPVHPSSPSSSSPAAAAATPRGVSVAGKSPRRGISLGPHDKLKRLEEYRHVVRVDGGTLEVRPMKEGDTVATVKLLAETFAGIMWVPPQQMRFLEFWVEQYLEQKRMQRPHAAVLVGIYRGEGGEQQVVAVAEVSFDEMGGGDRLPTPAPPRDAPYICNMAVKEAFRRRHIGWHLLKACEELILKMCNSTKVYLHCRVNDKGPLNMYKKAGYKILKTDNFLVQLRFKQRKHLMCKELPIRSL